jgi:hypothetical protein
VAPKQGAKNAASAARRVKEFAALIVVSYAKWTAIAGDDMLAATAQRLKTRNRKSLALGFTSALRAPSTAPLAYTSAR